MTILKARLQSPGSHSPNSVLIEAQVLPVELKLGTQFMGTLVFHEFAKSSEGVHRLFTVTLENSDGYDLHLT